MKTATKSRVLAWVVIVPALLLLAWGSFGRERYLDWKWREPLERAGTRVFEACLSGDRRALRRELIEAHEVFRQAGGRGWKKQLEVDNELLLLGCRENGMSALR